MEKKRQVVPRAGTGLELLPAGAWRWPWEHGRSQITLCPLAGTYYQTTDRGEVQDDHVILTLPNVSVSENGVYSATFMGDSPLWSAFYRLIVRGEQGPGCLGAGDCQLYPALWQVALWPPLLSLQPALRRSGDHPVRRTVPTV